MDRQRLESERQHQEAGSRSDRARSSGRTPDRRRHQPGLWDQFSDWAFGADPQEGIDRLGNKLPQPAERSDYMDQMRAGFAKYSAKPPWEMDPTQTAMYKASMLDIGEKAQARAQGQMRRAAARGGGSLQTGAATAMGNEQARRLDAAQIRAAGASAQGLASQHASYLNSLAQGMGFERGLMDLEFMQEYKSYLADQGLTSMEIEAEAQRVTEGWNRLFGMGKLAVSAYTAGQAPGAAGAPAGP